MLRKRNFNRDDIGAVGMFAMLLIGGIAFLVIGGLFFIWTMSMLPEIGIGVLYIAIAIAIVIGVANISKAMLNKTLPKVKARRTA